MNTRSERRSAFAERLASLRSAEAEVRASTRSPSRTDYVYALDERGLKLRPLAVAVIKGVDVWHVLDGEDAIIGVFVEDFRPDNPFMHLAALIS